MSEAEAEEEYKGEHPDREFWSILRLNLHKELFGYVQRVLGEEIICPWPCHEPFFNLNQKGPSSDLTQATSCQVSAKAK